MCKWWRKPYSSAQRELPSSPTSLATFSHAPDWIRTRAMLRAVTVILIGNCQRVFRGIIRGVARSR